MVERQTRSLKSKRAKSRVQTKEQRHHPHSISVFIFWFDQKVIQESKLSPIFCFTAGEKDETVPFVLFQMKDHFTDLTLVRTWCDYSKFGFRHPDNSPTPSFIKVDLESDTQVTFQSFSALEQSYGKNTIMKFCVIILSRREFKSS
jgi:hypothetical protein